jgi:hypothetical protein
LPRSSGVVLPWLPSMSPLPGKAYEYFCGYKVERLWRSIKTVKKFT